MVKDRLTTYLKGFGPKFSQSDEDEIQAFDEWFIMAFRPAIEKIIVDEHLNEKQMQEFLDIMYKVMFVKREFDGRYDNVLISDALSRVDGGF